MAPALTSKPEIGFWPRADQFQRRRLVWYCWRCRLNLPALGNCLHNR